MTDPLKSGAIFRITNPQSLKSPLPYHVLIQKQQQQMHQSSLSIGSTLMSPNGSANGMKAHGQNTTLLAKPQPVYALIAAPSTYDSLVASVPHTATISSSTPRSTPMDRSASFGKTPPLTTPQPPTQPTFHQTSRSHHRSLIGANANPISTTPTTPSASPQNLTSNGQRLRVHPASNEGFKMPTAPASAMRSSLKDSAVSSSTILGSAASVVAVQEASSNEVMEDAAEEVPCTSNSSEDPSAPEVDLEFNIEDFINVVEDKGQCPPTGCEAESASVTPTLDESMGELDTTEKTVLGMGTHQERPHKADMPAKSGRFSSLTEKSAKSSKMRTVIADTDEAISRVMELVHDEVVQSLKEHSSSLSDEADLQSSLAEVIKKHSSQSVELTPKKEKSGDSKMKATTPIVHHGVESAVAVNLEQDLEQTKTLATNHKRDDIDDNVDDSFMNQETIGINHDMQDSMEDEPMENYMDRDSKTKTANVPSEVSTKLNRLKKKNKTEKAVKTEVVEASVKRGRGRRRKSLEPAPLAKVESIKSLEKDKSSKSELQPKQLKKRTSEPRESCSKLDLADFSSKPGVHFTTWWLRRVVFMEKPDIVPVVVEGFRILPTGEQQLWHSSLITKRIDSRTLKSSSNNTYYLHGKLNVTGMKRNGYSQELMAEFEHGFPEDWREVVQSSQTPKEKAEKLKPTKEATTIVSKKTLPVIAQEPAHTDSSSNEDNVKAENPKMHPTTALTDLKPLHKRRSIVNSAPDQSSIPTKQEAMVERANSALVATRSRRRSGIANVELAFKLEWGTGRMKKLEKPEVFDDIATTKETTKEPQQSMNEIENSTTLKKDFNADHNLSNQENLEVSDAEGESEDKSSRERLMHPPSSSAAVRPKKHSSPAKVTQPKDGHISDEDSQNEEVRKDRVLDVFFESSKLGRRPLKKSGIQKRLEKHALKESHSDSDNNKVETFPRKGRLSDTFEVAPSKSRPEKSRPEKSRQTNLMHEYPSSESDCSSLPSYPDTVVEHTDPVAHSKRKRGRPPKLPPLQQEVTLAQEEKSSESDDNDRVWSIQEDRILEDALLSLDPKDKAYWPKVADKLPGRTAEECKSRFQSNFEKQGPPSNRPATSRPSKTAERRRSKVEVDSSGLPRKGTLARKRQLRKLIQQRNETHEEDDLFDCQTVEASPRKRLKVAPASDKEHKRKSLPKGRTKPSIPEESPEILKPFKAEDHDSYIRNLKRLDKIALSNNSKKNVNVPQRVVRKMMNDDSDLKNHKYFKVSQKRKETEASSDDDDEVESQKEANGGLRYYMSDDEE